MAKVFISHASADTTWAGRVNDWLEEDGHEPFLDSHPANGIPFGESWQRAIFERLRWADAVVCMLSPAYVKSGWCAAEVGAARVLGSELLPLNVGPDTVDDQGLVSAIQYVRLDLKPEHARTKLRDRLRVIDGGGGWGWPDGQSPYPGLRSFHLEEHRVFRGRAVEVKEITEQLRSEVVRRFPGLLTVEGPSGCGKSSLVRAGVLPRIADEGYWLTMSPMVPGADPTKSLLNALGELARAHDVTPPKDSDLTHDGLAAVAAKLLDAAHASRHCKLLIFIDQLEELLTQTPPEQRLRFCGLLFPALGGPVQALATLRPEFRDAAAKDPGMSTIPVRSIQVGPLRQAALHSVIEEPARLAGVSFEDDLVTRLVGDTDGGEALPLLAFTLEQLARGSQRGDVLTHDRYEAIGQVKGALQRRADLALQEACAATSFTTTEIIDSLLDLVTIDEQGRPAKRRAAWEELSEHTRSQLRPFIDGRLLATETNGARTLVAPAHDAFLGYWPPLSAEIETKATGLRARRIVENASRDWIASGRDSRDLLQGGALAKAEVDTGAELRAEQVGEADTGWRARLLVVIGQWRPGNQELVTRVKLVGDARDFLGASMIAARKQRLRLRATVIGVIAVLVVAATVSSVLFVQATAATRDARASAARAVAARLTSEAEAMLAQTKDGGDIQAFQKLLAAYSLDPDGTATALRAAVIQRMTTTKVIDTGASAWGLAISPDGRRLASSGIQATLRMWDADTGVSLGPSLGGHPKTIMAVAFSPDGKRLASGGQDGTARLWDVETGRPQGSALVGHSGWVSAVDFSPDGKLLVTASYDNTIRLWNAETGEPVGDPFVGHRHLVTSVVFTPDGQKLLSGSADGTVRAWDVFAAAPTIQELNVGTWVNGVAINQVTKRLATASDYGVLKLWDDAHPQGIDLTGHQGAVVAVAFSPDGRVLASVGVDKKVRLWKSETGQSLGALTGHTAPVYDVAFSPDGKQLWSASHDGTIRQWDIRAGLPLVSGDPGELTALALSPDGHRLATAGDLGRREDGGDARVIQLWNLDTGQPLTEPMMGHLSEITSLAFSPDGLLLASGSGDAMRLWDGLNGQSKGPPLVFPRALVESIAFSPDGQRLVDAGSGAVRTWDVTTRQLISEHELEFGFGQSVLDPLGRRGATWKNYREVSFWVADSGAVVSAPLQPSEISTIAMAPDGHRAALGGYDSAIRLWDVDTGEQRGDPLRGHNSPISALAFSPDGRLLMSTGSDKTVRLWDAETGQALGAPFLAHSDSVNTIAFLSDGRVAVTGGDDHQVRMWPIDATPNMLCDKLNENINPTQWRDWVSPDTAVEYRVLCPGLPVATE